MLGILKGKKKPEPILRISNITGGWRVLIQEEVSVESNFEFVISFDTLNISYYLLNHPASESESCSVVSNSLQPHKLYSPWNSPGQNIGVGSLSLLQGIFPTQGSNPGLPTEGSNPGLPHCRQILYQLSHQGSPRVPDGVAYPFSSRSSQPRNRTGISCIAGAFFTN